MRIGLIASPFLPVPPRKYGGTELFIANLAEGLTRMGVDAVVYSNGEAEVKTERRWCYPTNDWPLADPGAGMTKELDHVSWSIADAARDCDLIHVNSTPAITYSRFVHRPMICTLHHPHEQALTDLYQRYPEVNYAAISHHQASLHPTLKMQTIHHGIDLTQYRLRSGKDGYLSFLGRIAPVKGTHIAVQVAQKAGIPLKIAGEIQPIFQSYYDTLVKPHVDGRFIEYVGEADLAMKNELLGGSIGMLFPIQWDEPFGLVMLESMACGTPVLGFGRGSVPEVIRPGVSGEICSSIEDMAQRAQNLNFKPATVRQWVAKGFSVDAMTRSYLELYRRILSHKRPNPDTEIFADRKEVAA